MPAISVTNLTKKFGSFTAVEDLTFDVTENHVVGFLGLNGAGKTTTLRMLVSLSKPTKGKIQIAGAPMTFGSSAENKNIGYLPELPSMYNWMSGYEYLRFIADIFKMEPKKREAKIAEVLNLVNMEGAKNRRISTYSGGMKQRLGIAQALINDPKVIILDEPVSALDPIGRKEVLEIIEKLRSSRTVLFSTHVLSDVDRICDDVVIINKGKLVVSAPLSELKSKYASPILEVELVKNGKDLAKIACKESWAKKVEQNGSHLKIWLTDNGQIGGNNILKFLIAQNVDILSYGLSTPETEDLFIDLLEDKR